MMNLEHVLATNYQKWKNKEHFFEKVNGTYKGITYGEFFDHAKILANNLIERGLKDQYIMIYGENSIKLMLADFAVIQYVGVSVGASKEWKYDDVLQAVKRFDIPCLIYGEEKKAVVEKLSVELPSLMCISMDSFTEMIETGDKSAICPIRDENLCCKIVFSSGTTADPKAVMLSKKNLFSGVDSLYRRCQFNEHDVDYLFLPLSHTYGEIYNFLFSLIFGFSVYLCSGISEMGKEILTVNPTIFCGVPAVFRTFYENYGDNIHMAFGNRIKYLFCGGAYFEERIRKAYIESGLQMMGAYSLTETSATFSIQYPGDSDTLTAGTIAEDIDVKILNPDEDGVGEIVVKGDNIFLGYAGDEETTASVFTEDGYFRTGDLGYTRPDERTGGRRLYITGRIKKILIGENGMNIEPTHIEARICEKNANINKALLHIQDGKLSCRVYLKEKEQRDWDIFFEEINATLPRYENIRHYEVTLDSVEKRLKQ